MYSHVYARRHTDPPLNLPRGTSLHLNTPLEESTPDVLADQNASVDLSSWGNGGDLCTRQANLRIAELVPWHLGS